MRSIKQRLTYQSFFEELESRVVPSTLATGEVAWVMTDKSDYHPGTMAMISAGGFKIGERIDLRVANLTNGHIYPAFSATDGSAGDLDGKADGHIQTSWYVNWDCANSALHMTATGETSGATADYDFTDSATITSTATGGNWNSTTTWVGGVVPVSGDSVIIATTGANTVTVNGGGSITVGNMAVNSGATLDLNGKNLTIGGLGGAGSVTNNGNSASTLTINGSTSQTFSGVISNGSRTLSLIMAGTGTQTLSGTNTYTGVTTLNVGVLSVATIGNGGTAGNLGKATAAASNLVLGGGTLQYTGSTASTNRGFTLSAGTTSTIEITTATTNLTFSGASASTSGGLIKSGAGTLTLAAVNAYTGSTTVNAGTLSISADNNLGTAPGSATPGKLTLNGGTLATTATFTLNANRGISLGASGGTIDAASGATLTYNGIAAGTGSLTKTNTGILSLGGANTYSGDTIVSAGTLRLGINNALPGGTGKGNVVVNGTLDLNTFSSTIDGLSGSGTIDTAAGGAPTLTIGGNNASGTTFSGVIKDTTGTLVVTKVGTGSLTLSGINTYKGTTTISAGTLEVDGSQTNSSVTVNSGGTLSGTGTVGAITASGGTVIPGTSSGIGILTGSSANFSAGGTLLIQVNGLTTAGTDYARLNLTGTSTLGGTSKLTFNLSGLAADGTASGIVIYGSRSGAFNTVTVINSGYLAAANYNATSLDGVFDGPLTAGSFTPPTATEGQPFSNVVVFHFTDADPAAVAANFSALITWGDGTASTVTSSASANGQIVASGNGFDVQASHVYAEELSNVTFSVAVTDIGTSGHLATASASTSAFSVADQQLTNLASGNLPASGQENVAVPAITGIATFTDPAGAEPVGDYTATIRWGDTTTSTGTVVLVSGNNFRVDAPAHLYAEEGTYTVNVTLTHDALPAVTTPNQSITINDQQLTNLASGNLPASGQEGAPLPAITGIATFTDPAGAEPVGDYTATIHWGDTTTSTGTIVATGGGNFRVDAPAHTYVEEGSYTVNVTLTHDALPAVTTPNQTISIGDVAPTVAADKASVTAVEGTTVSNTGTFADIDDAVTITASRGTVTQDNSHDTWSWSGAAADDNAYDVTVTATNADGSTAAAIFHVSFTDASPVVTAALATVTAPENTAATNSGTYGDFDDAVSVSGPGVTDHHDGTWTWSGTGDEDQPYNVTVTATNANGSTSSTTFHVSFTDVPPTLVSLAHASVTTTTTVPVTNSGAFTDYDDAMTITASQGTLTDHGDGTWNWTQTGQVSDSGTVLVTVRNSDNHSASTTFSVIFNPAVSITTTSLADWTINQPGYNQTISASGGTGTLTFSSTGTLPTGLTLSTSGVLSGTPTAAGNYSFTVTATDTVGASGSQNYAVTINPAVTITTTTLPNWTMNQPEYSQTIDGSAGTGVCTFSSTGTLPTGLTLSSNGVLSGTPTAAGSCNFTVTATDTVGASGSQSYTVTINPTVNITTSTLANWTVNQPGYNQTISATGGTGALTFSSSGTLPAGLTLSSSGVLSGTPTAAGNYSFTVTATDTVGASSSQSYAVTINPAVSITTTTLPSGTLNQPGYSQTIMAAGGTGITTFALTSGTLPTGLTLSTGGVLSGTPTASGSYNFTVTATDTVGAAASQNYGVTINPPVTITNTTLTDWTVSQSGYNQTVTASGGTGTITFVLTSGTLPTGLTLSSSGVLSGTPTAAGSYSFTVTAADTVGASGSQSFTVTINPAVTITTTTLPNWTMNQPGYSQTIDASAGTGTLTFSSTGTLPTGLTLSSSGVLSGTPTAAGNYNFTVTATDTVGASGSQSYTVTINPTVNITSSTLANWTVNQPGYNQTVSATGGTGTLTFSNTGMLPTGLTLSSSGVLSGSPTAAGNYSFTVTATDTIGASGSQSYTVTINPTANITTSTLANWTVNQPGYHQTVSATGGTGALTFSSTGTLPTGLTLSTGGVFSGSPTAAGNYNFTVTATDTVGASANKSYTVTINPAVSITTTMLPNGTLNQPGYSQTITAAGGTGIATFALASGTLPIGLTLSTSGVLSGTPTASGSFNFTVTAADTMGASGSQSYTVTISPTVNVTTSTLANWTVNQPGYNQTVSATGGTGTLMFSSMGTLPAGLTLSSSGVLSGSPTASGSYNFTVTATDTVGTSTSKSFTVAINAAVNFTTTILPGWTVNQAAYNQTITVSGGTGTLTLSSTGTLPAGLTLSTAGVISGTPTATGTFLFTITATDSVNATVSHGYSVTVNPAVSTSTTALVNWTANLPGYSQTVRATGGTGTLTFSSTGALPTGLTLSSSGVLSGTPTASGNYNFTVTATDTVGASGSQSYTVTINPTVSITTTTLPGGTLNQPGYSQTITAAGGTGITTFALTSGTLPTGLTLSTGGVLSGTPSFAAIYAFTVTAMDSLGASVSQSYSLPIVGLNDPGFENPAVGNGGIRYNPSSSPWSFHGSAGLAGNGSPFTVGNPVAPQGSQVAFIQALSSVSQNMVLPAGTFTLSFGAAQRGNVQAGGQTLQVLIDGTVIATFNNLTSTSYTNQVSSSFTVKAGSHALVFQGTDLHGGDNTMFVDQVAVNALPAGLADSGFESIVVGNGSSQYNPTGSPWTFQGGAGVTGNGSPFTAGNPNAPQGSQVAFIQALGGISQVVACPAGTYVITFDAAQRGNVQAGGQTFQVLIDGNVIGSFTNLIGTAYTSQATSSFTVSAGNHTLLLRGTDLHGGDNTILVDQFAITSQATNLNDSGFETPVVANGSFQVNPAGSPWTFQGSAGLTGNGSLLTNGNPNAPQGSQVAFVQALGSISQSVTFAAGTYSLNFLAAQRANVQAGGQTFQILVDGTVVGIFNNLVATSYTALSSASFTVTAGSHTLTIQGTDLKGGDNTVLVDQFLINPLG